MCSPFRNYLVLLLAVTFSARAADTVVVCCGGEEPAKPATRPASEPGKRVLRVASDPNNLPFSNEKREGFENKIAELVAKEMGATIEYTWRAQRRGFFRETLKHGDIDLVPGVPRDSEMALTTVPYYRSSYVFVTRRDGGTPVSSFDDPALRRMKIGVQVTGGANTPPMQALGRRGIVDNIVGYSVFGDYAEESPPAAVIRGVAKGEVDVAVAWGPLAGYFAKRQPVPLAVTPVSPQVDEPSLPLAFDISMGVSRKNKALRDEVNAVLAKKRAEIDRILDGYGVPRVAAPVSQENSEKSGKSSREESRR